MAGVAGTLLSRAAAPLEPTASSQPIGYDREIRCRSGQISVSRPQPNVLTCAGFPCGPARSRRGGSGSGRWWRCSDEMRRRLRSVPGHACCKIRSYQACVHIHIVMHKICFVKALECLQGNPEMVAVKPSSELRASLCFRRVSDLGVPSLSIGTWRQDLQRLRAAVGMARSDLSRRMEHQTNFGVASNFLKVLGSFHLGPSSRVSLFSEAAMCCQRIRESSHERQQEALFELRKQTRCMAGALVVLSTNSQRPDCI